MHPKSKNYGCEVNAVSAVNVTLFLLDWTRFLLDLVLWTLRGRRLPDFGRSRVGLRSKDRPHQQRERKSKYTGAMHDWCTGFRLMCSQGSRAHNSG
jgi:hypothetical protein